MGDPHATDIAFALAVLAVTGSHLPSALRTFLLTLAVMDDLLAIVIIAVVFTTDLAILVAVRVLVGGLTVPGCRLQVTAPRSFQVSEGSRRTVPGWMRSGSLRTCRLASKIGWKPVPM